MKRTAAITLLALGAGAVTIYSLAGENGSSAVPDDGTVFTSKEQCAASGKIAPDDCTHGWDAAQKDHEAKAPHFKTLAECEGQYGPGKCAAPSGAAAPAADFFIPAMAAYMIGRGWTSAGCPPAPLLRQRGDQADQYRLPGGYAGCRPRPASYSGGSYAHGGSGGGWIVSSRTSTARGGFGATGRGFSGFSGA